VKGVVPFPGLLVQRTSGRTYHQGLRECHTINGTGVSLDKYAVVLFQL